MDSVSWHQVPALPLVACVVVRQGGQVACYGIAGEEPVPLESKAPGELRTSICYEECQHSWRADKRAQWVKGLAAMLGQL